MVWLFLPLKVFKMHTAWFRELCIYAESYICNQLGLTAEQGYLVINRLQSINILRRVKKNDSSDGEVLLKDMDEIITEDDRYLTFTFVGILMLNDVVIRCYPKYLKKVTPSDLSTHFNLVLSVIRKYEKNREQNIHMGATNLNSVKTLSLLSIVLEIIEQYKRTGFYQVQETIEEINGTGEIDWEKTVHETQTLISNGRPFYPYIYTKQNIWNDMNFFYCLHRCIVGECFEIIEKAGLTTFLGIQGFYRTDIHRNLLGSDDFLLRRIECELTCQFVTSKRQILQLMQLYLLRQGKQYQSKLYFYGTNSMNLVWETACGAVLKNQLKLKFTNKNFPELSSVKLKRFHANDKTLLQMIDRPEWIANGLSSGIKKDTIIPDCIRIRNDQNNQLTFCIYDAKYYNIVFNSKAVTGQPGIESVTKQYLYHMAYRKLLDYFEISKVQNIFLFPSDSQSRWLGHVTLPLLNKVTGTDVLALALNATRVFQYYLEDKEMPTKEVFYHRYTYESPAS